MFVTCSVIVSFLVLAEISRVYQTRVTELGRFTGNSGGLRFWEQAYSTFLEAIGRYSTDRDVHWFANSDVNAVDCDHSRHHLRGLGKFFLLRVFLWCAWSLASVLSWLICEPRSALFITSTSFGVVILLPLWYSKNINAQESEYAWRELNLFLELLAESLQGNRDVNALFERYVEMANLLLPEGRLNVELQHAQMLVRRGQSWSEVLHTLPKCYPDGDVQDSFQDLVEALFSGKNSKKSQRLVYDRVQSQIANQHVKEFSALPAKFVLVSGILICSIAMTAVTTLLMLGIHTHGVG